MGDRYDRSHIMLFGLTLWSLATLIGSFMYNFWWFMFFRAVVGIGEASYSTIAPAIISDLFRNDTRSKVMQEQSSFNTFFFVIRNVFRADLGTLLLCHPVRYRTWLHGWSGGTFSF